MAKVRVRDLRRDRRIFLDLGDRDESRRVRASLVVELHRSSRSRTAKHVPTNARYAHRTAAVDRRRSLFGLGACLEGERFFLRRTAVPGLTAARHLVSAKAALASNRGKIESFLLTLANALKATPSIGSALSYTQPLLAAPLDQELELALKEMRVGSSLDQALLNLAARVRSPKLDAALASLLIGRQVGGNLTQILETTAATLREMSRLRGVVRSKTAEGKSQLFVLALFPAVLVFMFDWLKPNYFAPLMNNVAGALIGLMALSLWAASIVLARKVLMVDL